MIANDFPTLVFGETIYQDPQLLPQYINAENSDVERGLANTGRKHYLSCIVRKHVFGVFDQVRHKLDCTITEDCSFFFHEGHNVLDNFKCLIVIFVSCIYCIPYT